MSNLCGMQMNKNNVKSAQNFEKKILKGDILFKLVVMQAIVKGKAKLIMT